MKIHENNVKNSLLCHVLKKKFFYDNVLNKKNEF